VVNPLAALEAAVRFALTGASARLRRRRRRHGVASTVDAGLDAWLERVFAEVKRGPVVQTERDFIGGVRRHTITSSVDAKEHAMSTSSYSEIHEGMDVLDRDGDKIGKAGETVGQFFNVDAGFLGGKEYYVPFDAVMEVRDNAIYLNADKDEVDAMGWERRPEDWTTARSTTAVTGEAGERLELREEELQARKTPVETGRVSLSKEVVEEQRTLEVPVSREEVTIERHAVERRPSDRPIDASESETIRVPVREERVEVDKQPVVYEEVGVGKRQVTETQQVSETVRREELRTDKHGDPEIRTEEQP